MIPFSTYSLKMVYLVTLIGYRVYVRLDIYWIPMVYPSAFPIDQDKEQECRALIKPDMKPIPIASYYFNGFYWSRSSPDMAPTSMSQNK